MLPAPPRAPAPQAYVLVLFDTPVCLLGAGYLLLVIGLLLAPPGGDSYAAWLRARGGPAPPGARCGGGAAGARGPPGRGRWALPWLLAAAAVADLTAQYSLVVTARAAPGAVPEWLSDFLLRACGIDAGAAGAALWLALLRPVALLAGIHVYRWAGGFELAWDCRHEESRFDSHGYSASLTGRLAL
jgi:hypothetical protein